MRILMIAPEPFLEPRGTPISVYHRAKGLGSLGHAVDLLTYHAGKHVEIPGVTIHRTPRIPWIREVKVGPSWYKPILDLLLLWKAVTFLLRKRYDVIHSHEEAAFFSMLLAFLFRTRHLYDMHSSLPRQLANFQFGNHPPFVKLFELLERMVIRTCDGIITIGADLEQYVKGMKPQAPQVMIENLAVQQPTPLDPRSTGELRRRLGLEGKTIVVYTGTFERYQGIGLLIESARIVRQRYPEVAYLLVGGKPDQVESFRRRVEELELEGCVVFAGSVPLEDVGAYLALADVLVSPRVEGTSVPLKVYTYLHEGKAIVATKLIAHTLVLSEQTAVLVEPTREGLADGVIALLRDPDLRRALGQRAKEVAAERYGPGRYLSRLQELYRALETPARVPVAGMIRD